MQLAGFPAPWRLDDVDYDAQPKLDRHLIADLATLRFVDEAANILFIGWTPACRCATCRTSPDTPIPKTTRRYDRSRHALNRHATYAIAHYLAGGT